MFCAIDIQGFSGLYTGQSLTPKELAVCSSDGESRVYFVKPKAAYAFLNDRQQRIVHWATLRHHGLNYSSGTHTQEEVETELVRITAAHTVYTKGRDKKAYLEKVLGRPVVDLTSRGCPPFRVEESKCCKEHFKENAFCAVAGASFLFEWLNGDSGGSSVLEENQQAGEEPVPRGSVCSKSDSQEPKETGCVCN